MKKSISNTISGLARRPAHQRNAFFLAFLLLLSLAVFGSTASAQSRTCKRLGYKDVTLPIDGVWRLEYSGGQTVYVTTLYMEGKNGKGITRFFSEDDKKTHRVEQTFLLCQATRGLVVRGFAPKDLTNDDPYSADSFFLRRLPDGKMEASFKDDNGNESGVEIRNLRDLTDADSSYIRRKRKL